MKRKLLLAAVGAVGAILIFAGPAGASDDDSEAAAQVVQAVLDNIWVFIARHTCVLYASWVCDA